MTVAASGEDFVYRLASGKVEPPHVVHLDISMNYATEGIQASPETKVMMFTISEGDNRV